MDTSEPTKRTRVRASAPQFKAQVLAECSQPGASVAKVALANGLNANIDSHVAPTGARCCCPCGVRRRRFRAVGRDRLACASCRCLRDVFARAVMHVPIGRSIRMPIIPSTCASNANWVNCARPVTRLTIPLRRQWRRQG
jgi:hypothetical protein